jgi:hypothetical protein
MVHGLIYEGEKNKEKRRLLELHGNPLYNDAVAGFSLMGHCPQTLWQPCNKALEKSGKEPPLAQSSYRSA